MAEPPSSTIGVVIVDDHRMFGDSLARLLDEEEGMTVLGVAGDGAEGVALVARTSPQVVLVDYRMPEQDGIEVARQIRRADPRTMVVMLTGAADEQVLFAAIEAGCSGFVTKDGASDEVVHAVRAAAAGEALISPTMLARLLPRLARTQQPADRDLSDHERELLGYLARGWTNRVIADTMFLSLNTIRNHVQTVLGKLGAHSKLEAVATAVREGIIEYPSAP